MLEKINPVTILLKFISFLKLGIFLYLCAGLEKKNQMRVSGRRAESPLMPTDKALKK